ncbi:hypothetical protein L218DRAFT_955500 [Marasmius fiardii PR-910]|nr:hypothetical protein L218DRAFT_955500 [Marasmius fiardii PR-910]
MQISYTGTTAIENAAFNNVGSDQVNINTGTVFHAPKTLEDALYGVEASYISQRQVTRGTCLPGTCEAALKHLHDWKTFEAQEYPICWVSGAAGVGKSAGLVASFFFFRSDTKRNNPSSIMPKGPGGTAYAVYGLIFFVNHGGDQL